MYLSYNQIKEMTPNIIQGQIVAQHTNEPLENVHVNILYNSESVLSSNNGVFVLRLWQTFPITLVVEHKLFKSRVIKIQSPQKNCIISLQPNADI